jgi:hypothetical protein
MALASYNSGVTKSVPQLCEGRTVRFLLQGQVLDICLCGTAGNSR